MLNYFNVLCSIMGNCCVVVCGRLLYVEALIPMKSFPIVQTCFSALSPPWPYILQCLSVARATKTVTARCILIVESLANHWMTCVIECVVSRSALVTFIAFFEIGPIPRIVEPYVCTILSLPVTVVVKLALLLPQLCWPLLL